MPVLTFFFVLHILSGSRTCKCVSEVLRILGGRFRGNLFAKSSFLNVNYLALPTVWSVTRSHSLCALGEPVATLHADEELSTNYRYFDVALRRWQTGVVEHVNPRMDTCIIRLGARRSSGILPFHIWNLCTNKNEQINWFGETSMCRIMLLRQLVRPCRVSQFIGDDYRDPTCAIWLFDNDFLRRFFSLIFIDGMR